MPKIEIRNSKIELATFVTSFDFQISIFELRG